MKIGCISDTHCFHGLFDYSEFDGLDMLLFAGDCSTVYLRHVNLVEVLNFIEWFESIPIKYKIWVAGNHDTSIESKLVIPKEILKSSVYLEHDEVVVEGLRIFGSPYTPTFGNWAFMKSRTSINRVWETLPDEIDILITHGPPKGILDLSYNQQTKALEKCGDSSLFKKVMKIKPKLHVFGHIHNNEDNYNAGHFFANDINFINASCVEDGKFGRLSSRVKTIII